jgi:hypothetical protein
MSSHRKGKKKKKKFFSFFFPVVPPHVVGLPVPAAKLRNFNWKKVPMGKIPGTFWGEPELESFKELNFVEFEELFAINQKPKDNNKRTKDKKIK